MPTTRILSRLVVCSFGLLLASPTAAQQLPQPTAEHQELDREVGVWDAEVRMWMDPSAPPSESTATETVERFGRFFVNGHYVGSFAGQPFEGRSQLTYDPEADEYVCTWIDTFTPMVTVSRGPYDAETKTLTLLSGEHKCVMTGQQKRTKMVTVYPDDDHKHFEIHETPAGADEWTKIMEIDYTRRAE